MTISSRPSDLPFRTKDGLYSTWLPKDNDFDEFITRAIDWSSPDHRAIPNGNIDLSTPSCGYALLDSFFADFLSPTAVKKILDCCTTESPLRVLLLDPTCSYAIARATNLTTSSASRRMAKGLGHLAEAADKWVVSNHSYEERLNIEEVGGDFDSSVVLLQETIRRYDVPIDLKFYSVMPSGPRLFLADILISGFFSFDRSSTQLPWYMHVDTPVEHDVYSTFLAEFDRIWGYESTVSEMPSVALEAE